MVWCLSLQSIFPFVSKKGKKEKKRTKEKEKKSYHEIEYIQKNCEKKSQFGSCVVLALKFEPIATFHLVCTWYAKYHLEEVILCISIEVLEIKGVF
jgi:hypothetical protein